MLNNNDNLKNNSFPIGFNKLNNVEGLEIFKKKIEKHFFSTAIINCSLANSSLIKLTITLNCNYSIIEMLHHFNNGNWGNFECKNESLENLLDELQESNNMFMEIEELSIFLRDTSLIINSIYKHSIPEQLENILRKIGNHYVYFTRGIVKIPYEIYIPVFEGNKKEKYPSLINPTKTDFNKNDFFNYWGLYFYTVEEAEIYDINNFSVISGKLHMINRD